MAQSLFRLGDGIRLRVIYEDQSKFGSAASGFIEDRIRVACREIVETRATRGLNEVVGRSRELLGRAMAGGLAALYERPGVLRDECVFPDAGAVNPCALAVHGARGEVLGAVALEASLRPELSSWLGAWQAGEEPPSSGPARRLWDDLSRAGAFTRESPRPPVPGEVVFAGHATVRVASGRSAALFDPFVLPAAATHPPGYQPFTLDELAPAAVFVSHSHPDHFDIGTLLRLGAETPIYVPHVPRESLLAIDMEARLRQLGFADVHVLRWHEQVDVAGTRVTALPFYGEQPTTGEQLHPEARNCGNLYFVEAPASRLRVALTVDAGVDSRGSVADVARQAYGRCGAADLVFGGYRSWALYPIRYVFSSVGRYLLFVPEDQWLVRQKIMNDADDILDTCECWHARHLLPYADGGAPWYWELGLGPRLDGQEPSDVHFDPTPEHVRRAASQRSSAREGFVASPVQVHVPRPGDVLSVAEDAIRVARPDGHRWPYAEAAS